MCSDLREWLLDLTTSTRDTVDRNLVVVALEILELEWNLVVGFFVFYNAELVTVGWIWIWTNLFQFALGQSIKWK